MRPYLVLAKPRISLMVAVTAFFGWWLAGGGWGWRLVLTLLGTALSSAATGSLNQLIEREQDSLMRRTRSRPLPSGALSAGRALAFGLACAVLGLSLTVWAGGPLAGVLTAFTMACYLAVYTPLKLVTPQSTWVGAVAGAMPPVIGWAAARGTLEPEAWVLFTIQFLWQIPHFLALFWIHREDYAAAGFQVMPVVDPSGRATSLQVALHSFGLFLASILPVLMGMAGWRYGLGAAALGGAFLVLGLRASWTMTPLDSRRLFLASLLYLPALWGMLAAGVTQSHAARFNPEPPPPVLGRAPDFELQDARGRTVRGSDIRGPWVASFIFTRCAGQCPMMAAQLRGLQKRLPGLTMVSISVDPSDGPRELDRFARTYQAGWLLLRGETGVVERLSREGFKLPVEAGSDPAEPIIHSKSLVLVDGAGRVRGYFDGTDAAAVAELETRARRL